MKKALPLILICLFFFCACRPASGQEISPQEIVKRSDDLMRGDTQQGTYTMAITTLNWQRTLVLYVASKGRDQMFIRILSPAKEKGITTLRMASEMWNYLPSVERTIKIPPSMMLQPWMGSDFANDDLVKESSVVNDYDHRLLRTENLDGVEVWCLELIPKPHAGVVWNKRLMWIRTKDFIPVRDEFYGKNDKLIKVLTYSNVKKISDRMIPTHWEMTSEIKKGNRTVIEVGQDVVYNEPIDENVFSLQNLKSSL
ncbi:MAG: outer membrane lipoprotein-sorting protein [Candidatus Omnitrophota bacterium]